MAGCGNLLNSFITDHDAGTLQTANRYRQRSVTDLFQPGQP